MEHNGNNNDGHTMGGDGNQDDQQQHLHHHTGDIPPSPSHFGFPGSFLAEDLQELLGAMRDEQDANTGTVGGYFPGSFSHNSLASNSSSQEVSSNTAAAAANRQASSSPPIESVPPRDCSAKAQARSERKRSRERQRRSDVNRQFTDLTEVLRRIEEEDHASNESNNAEKSSSGDGGDPVSNSLTAPSSRFTFSPANRVDLIAKTITMLERLHAANQKRKRMVCELQEELERAKKAGEDAATRLKQVGTMYSAGGNNNKIMMMVPMMVSSDMPSGAPTSAAFPMPHPYMQHAAYMPMPHAQPPTSVLPANDASSSNHQLHSSNAPGVALAAPSNPTHAYPHHQHHASFPSFMPMISAAAATTTAHAPYIFHPGMAQAAVHQDHMMVGMSAVSHGIPSFQPPGNNSVTNQNATGNVNNNNNEQSASSSSNDASSSQQEAKVASVPLSSGGNLAHCA